MEDYLNSEFIKSSINNNYKVFESFINRDYWLGMQNEVYDKLISLKEVYDNMEFRVLTATSYMEYSKNGNRMNFEEEHFKRRRALNLYTILEAIENKNTYMDKIVDILWMILEESTWCVPAHGGLVENADALPCDLEYSLDLFMAESGCTISFVYCVLGEKLNKYSKNILPKIKRELNSRIIDNYLTHNDYWWMGYEKYVVNNWNPWINSNVLCVALNVCDDIDTKTKVVYKVIETLEKYFKDYPKDGACDEGPQYWFQAGLSVLECLYFISCVTDNAICFFNDEKVINTFQYIAKAYIAENKFVNFADASSKIKFSYGSIYKFAEILCDDNMKCFSKKMSIYFKDDASIFDLQKPLRILDTMIAQNKLKNVKDEFLEYENVYLESVNFFVAKERTKNLYLASKGGTNAENHNHNDIGNFIIYKENMPFIIDVGNMVYTKDTFSKNRYKIWTNVSQYHNLPTINNQNQKDGLEYCATDVFHSFDDEKSIFSLNIKNAYENKNDINIWNRKVKLDKKNCIINITETYDFKDNLDISLNFMCATKPIVKENIIEFISNNTTMKMKIDLSQFLVQIETLVLEDALLISAWGKTIYRLILIKTEKTKSGTICYSVE